MMINLGALGNMGGNLRLSWG